MNGHGPDVSSHEKATNAELVPVKLEDTLAFMFESREVISPTAWALDTATLQPDYDDCWQFFAKARLP
jgi:homogentisate 1,2-dioxygenase